ncbi:MAG: insulinase family protein [Lachnospiraceae bacterium]|nr:insulinase family protein [Lachnospiraceae bacterium]
MKIDSSCVPSTYEIIKSGYIKETASEAALLVHVKSGARIAVLSNNDNNKVFSIGFRTPPANSTGVAHIMEHSVLCGSSKYPVKDPFVELMKGSLATFLNAMTYPDKTVYPVASCNETDFRNLMDIYLDSVFHPNIYLHDEIFRQEGWRYELENEDDPLSINGVVYNEMKGDFSSPDSLIVRSISDTLFPDTAYGVDSGGDPDHIPELTYDEFLDFHRKYYHPCNSYIYLYGDMDVRENLEYIDREYLSNYERIEVDSEIKSQAGFEKPVDAVLSYPVESGGDNSGAYLACSWVIGEKLDPQLYYAFQILEYVLMEAPAAPLKKMLVSEGYGSDVYGMNEFDILQPYMSVIVKGTDPAKKNEITGKIRSLLEKLADGELSRKSIESAINFFEFKMRENDFGRFPKGLIIGLQAMSGWIYDDNEPFKYLEFEKYFPALREAMSEGYFEGLIKEYLLDNPHSSVVLMTPDPGMISRKEKENADKMAAVKAEMSDEEIKKLVQDTAELKEYQSASDPDENLEKIPLLELENIRKESLPLHNELRSRDGYDILWHNINTNGILYTKLLFEAMHIREEELPYLALLSDAIGDMDTELHSYEEFSDEENFHTGGISTGFSIYRVENSPEYKFYFKVNGRVLYGKKNELLRLTEEMLVKTLYSDKARLKEILQGIKSRLEMGFMSAGHSFSMKRAESYRSAAGRIYDLTGGIDYYRFISECLADYDSKADSISESLTGLARKVFRRELMLVDATCDAEGYEGIEELFDMLADHLFANELNEEDKVPAVILPRTTANEAFIIPGTVQYNSMIGDYLPSGMKYDPRMSVLKNILSSEYLWNTVRVLGGAYGAFFQYGEEGDFMFSSYRDPKAADTFDAYRGAVDYLKEFDPSERDFTKFLLGTFGSIDMPLTPQLEGERSLSAFMTGKTEEELNSNRSKLLNCRPEDIRAFADAVRCALENANICSIGSRKMLEQDKERFHSFQELIG